jgi:hypothetical protein
VGIESIEHALERAVDKFLVTELASVDVIVAHAFEDDRKELEVGVDFVLFAAGRGGKINLRSDNEIQTKDDGEGTVKQSSLHTST